MNIYLLTFSNVAHYITYRVVARDEQHAIEVATKIADKIDQQGLAQEEYQMQTGDDREAWDYRVDSIERDHPSDGCSQLKLYKDTEALRLDRLQVDAGGNG